MAVKQEMMTDATGAYMQRARQVMPGGTNSSTRVNKALGFPLIASRAEGARVYDLEGTAYLDMCCAHGAGLLGHAHPAIDRAVEQARRMGYTAVFETEYHEELARRICEIVPCADRVRFCSAGSEATLHLIRACRAFTGRDKILRIEGHFHGYHEMIYIGGHPPRERFASNRRDPFIESDGIPRELAHLIIPIPNNDIGALETAIGLHGHEIALVILEPVNWNWAGIEAQIPYLQRLRKLTRDAGIVLFFDEIQGSFKTREMTMQRRLGIMPDVTTIGKAMGGGIPLSAFCGRADIMDGFKPVGNVQHSGTFNATLIPVLAGLEFLNEAEKPDFYDRLEKNEKRFLAGVERIVNDLDINLITPSVGARFNIVLGTRRAPQRYEDAFCHDASTMLRFIAECYRRQVYFHDYGGSPAHHGFSVQHTDEDIDRVLNVMEESLREVAHLLR